MHRSFGREVAGVVLRAGVVLFTIVLVVWFIELIFSAEASDISDGTCSIAVLPVDGAILPFTGFGDFELITTPDSIESFMRLAEVDPNIDAVLVEINSPGGTPVASERIAERFRTSELPVIGLVGDIAASGGYMIAAATDHVIASPMSDVGSIGVSMSYLEESIKNEEEGLTYVQLTTGKFKDAGSPNRPITEEERERFEADLDVIHQHFVDLVAKYRELPREEVEAMADGASMPGARALEVGLIDSLGGRTKAREILAFVLDKDESAIEFCEYERSFLPF